MASGVGREDSVIEVGPGLGSLTLPLLDAAGRVVAVEIDRVLAERLPRTVAERAPELADSLQVVGADALAVTAGQLGTPAPTALVANLPYNVSVPVLLTGGIVTPEAAETLLERQCADLIGVGRAILRDSDWARRAFSAR